MNQKIQVTSYKLQVTLSAFCFLPSAFCLLLFAFCFLPSVSYAQADPPIRVELECDKDQQDFHFVSLSNYGAAVFYPSALLSADTMQWILIHYDSNLVKKEIYRIKLPNQSQYLAADFNKDKLYLFFQKPAQRKDTIKNYLFEWDLSMDDFQVYDLQNFKNQYLSSIKVVDDYLFVVVNDQKYKSIIHYNYKTNRKQTTQYIDDEITSIESFTVDTLIKRTFFSLFLKNKQSSRAELIVTDYAGNVKQREIFPFNPELIYNSARTAVLGKDSLLIVGGYSHIKDKKQSGCFSGVYTYIFTNNSFSEINTNSFGALLSKDSVVNSRYLGESNITMNLHIKQYNGKVFAVTEVFYPEYQYTTSNSYYRSYGYYGYDPPIRVFSGFRFLNAYIMEFDKQGKKTEQWYFPIQNVLTQSFYNIVNLYQNDEGSSLFYYVNKNELVSQFMYGQIVLDPQSATKIGQSYKTDVVEYSSNVVMRHWYDNNFLVSGYQYIKNTQRGKGKRYVFFLNKMICE